MKSVPFDAAPSSAAGPPPSALPAGADAGLSTAEADRRFARYGANDALSRHDHRSPWRSLLARLHNPLIFVLLLTSGFAAAAGEIASFAIITVMILLGVLLDFLQEMRADHTVDALRRSVALRASVLRDGHLSSVPIERLVPGDVIRLGPGDVVPGDAQLLATQALHVDEALLTGEPYPTPKRAVPGEIADDGAARAGMVFTGTSVISGMGTALVVRTGRATALGDLAETLSRRRGPDAFELGIRRFGMLILRVTILLVLTVLAVSLFVHRPWLESLMFALALAVGLTPELLPMITTVTLATGARRLLKRQVIVKRLAAVHDLGRLDVLCTDKTGTLTDAVIRLAAHVGVAGGSSDRVLHLAQLNSSFSGGARTGLDIAIMAAASHDDEVWSKCGEIPFDFERRRSSVLLAADGARLLAVKGAPEDVLVCCTAYETEAGAIEPLDAVTRARLSDTIDRLGEGGYRVLGIASRVLSVGAQLTVASEKELVFAGFVTFVDPPKQGAAAALHGLVRAGVAIKVLTGDTAAVARHVCAELGLQVGDVLTGLEVDRLGDEALLARLPSTTLFCRVTPQQKRRIVMLLKRRGLVVGFLGDGVNDTAALREADVGISVDTAADVAKEAADLILLKRDLKPIYDGVLEGRRAVQNAMKYVLMASSSNFGNMISMAVAAVFMPFLPMLPIQVLLNNLLYDVSELALPGDRVDLSALRRPVAWDMHRVARYMLVFGALSSVFDAITFSILIFGFDADMALFRTGWFIESLATQVLVIFVLRSSQPFWRGRPSAGLAALSLGVVALACALPLTPLGPLLGFREPPVSFFIFLALMTVAYLAMAEFAKRLLSRRFQPLWKGGARWLA